MENVIFYPLRKKSLLVVLKVAERSCRVAVDLHCTQELVPKMYSVVVAMDLSERLHFVAVTYTTVSLVETDKVLFVQIQLVHVPWYQRADSCLNRVLQSAHCVLISV